MPSAKNGFHGEGFETLEGALAALPHQWRAALWLRHGFGVPEARLAKAWGIPLSNMRTMLSQARRKLEAETNAQAHGPAARILLALPIHARVT